MSRFKVGDKVRYKGASELRFERIIEVGDEGTVIGKGFYDEDVCVSFGVADYAPIEDLELVASADKKRKFLERLQELLRGFDAQISFYEDEDEASLCFDFGDHTPIYYTKQFCGDRRFEFPLTADNIMDFDKE